MSGAADEALERLRRGNERFVAGEARFPTQPSQIRALLARGQRPFATVLGCSDSRVPPELLFDAGLGELFVVRVAGNVVSAEVLGTLQYAGIHLRTPLFVVLGHSGCGAVEAALGARQSAEREHAHIAHLLDAILPGLRDVDSAAPHERALDAAVEANVRWSVRQVLATPEAQRRLAEGEMKLVGAVYELESGRVRWVGSGAR
jgi:carbonic anhydrase